MQEELALLLSYGVPVQFGKKDFLIRQGERSVKVYFLKKGVIRHFVVTPDGREKTIRLSRENDLFYSSIVSYYNNEPSYIYCQCLTDCELLSWDRNELEDLFARHRQLADLRNQQHIQFILEKHRKEITLLTKNAAERFREFCRENLELFNRIPHHIIASYLDITPETLSRLRRKNLDPDQW